MEDEADMDEWFSSRKEELSERMMLDLEHGVVFETAQQRFDKDFKNVLAEYDTRYREAAVAEARHERLVKPWRQIRLWLDARNVEFELWKKHVSEHYQRWRFEKKFKRLFKIK